MFGLNNELIRCVVVFGVVLVWVLMILTWNFDAVLVNLVDAVDGPCFVYV